MIVSWSQVDFDPVVVYWFGVDFDLVLVSWFGVDFESVMVFFLGIQTVVASGFLPVIETEFELGSLFGLVIEVVSIFLAGTEVGAFDIGIV